MLNNCIINGKLFLSWSRVGPLKYGERAVGLSQPSKFGRLEHRLVVVRATIAWMVYRIKEVFYGY